MTSADYHPGPAFDVLGKLRAAEAAISRVKALADRWEREAEERGPEDTLYTGGVAAMIHFALRGDS